LTLSKLSSYKISDELIMSGNLSSVFSACFHWQSPDGSTTCRRQLQWVIGCTQ